MEPTLASSPPQQQLVPHRPADFLKMAFVRRMIPVAQSIPQTPTLTDLETVRLDIPHLEEVANQFHHLLPEEDLIWPYIGLLWFYKAQSKWTEAEDWGQKGLAVSQDLLGADHPTNLSSLAILYKVQARYSEAEPLLKRSLLICEEQLGQTIPLRLLV